MDECTGATSTSSTEIKRPSGSLLRRRSSFEEALVAACKAERSLESFLLHSSSRMLLECRLSEPLEELDVEDDEYSMSSELEFLQQNEEELRRELDLIEDSTHEELLARLEGVFASESSEEVPQVTREDKRDLARVLQTNKKADLRVLSSWVYQAVATTEEDDETDVKPTLESLPSLLKLSSGSSSEEDVSEEMTPEDGPSMPTRTLVRSYLVYLAKLFHRNQPNQAKSETPETTTADALSREETEPLLSQ